MIEILKYIYHKPFSQAVVSLKILLESRTFPVQLFEDLWSLIELLRQRSYQQRYLLEIETISFISVPKVFYIVLRKVGSLYIFRRNTINHFFLEFVLGALSIRFCTHLPVGIDLTYIGVILNIGNPSEIMSRKGISWFGCCREGRFCTYAVSRSLPSSPQVISTDALFRLSKVRIAHCF